MTHSLAPVLEWRSLMWFEVAEVKRGGVIAYGARHLEPAHELQGAIPRDQLFDRTVCDGRQAIQIFTDSVEKLAELLTVAVLAPPPILWRACETDQLFLEREAASEASRQASDLPPPLGWRANSRL